MLAALPKAPSRYNPYKDIKLATFRRNLVLKNLYENNYINFEKYSELKKKKIKLRKTKKVFLEDSQYFIEDIRKKIINDLGFEKVYKQGFNINTPIDLNLQKFATDSLRKGLIEYDLRKGWRGPLLNVKNLDKDWFSGLDKYKLEKTIGWRIAIVKNLNNYEVEIQTDEGEQGTINLENIPWTKKNFKDLFEIGDIIYVERTDKSNNYDLRQKPPLKANTLPVKGSITTTPPLISGFCLKS